MLAPLRKPFKASVKNCPFCSFVASLLFILSSFVAGLLFILSSFVTSLHQGKQAEMSISLVIPFQ